MSIRPLLNVIQCVLLFEMETITEEDGILRNSLTFVIKTTVSSVITQCFITSNKYGVGGMNHYPVTPHISFDG